MELIRFCTQDTNHIVGTGMAAWLLFEGLKSLILAFHGKE